MFFCSLWGWVALVFPHPMFWLWNGLVFWFWLFFSCGWDGESGILPHGLTWFHVGWDGMRMGKYVGSWILGVCNRGFVTSYFCRHFSDNERCFLFLLAFLVCLIVCVLFVWVWGATNCTLHWGLWIWLLFWFGLFFVCCLSVGRGIVPHSVHGCYVEMCECECGGM